MIDHPDECANDFVTGFVEVDRVGLSMLTACHADTFL